MSQYKRPLLILACVLFIGTLFGALRSITRSVPTAGVPDTLPVIILDPGHGGMDGGAVGVDGIVEKDINLAIALQMRDMFTVSGFEVVMTREEDISIHDEGISGTQKQKSSDMHNRLRLIQEHPNAILISVHQNKFTSSSAKGAQIFYSPNHSGSEQLAGMLQYVLAQSLQPDNTRQPKKAEKNLFLMTESKCPAVLVECGFLSHPEEAQLLATQEYQSRLAFVVYCGVMEYLEMDQPVAAPWPIDRLILEEY